MTISLLSFRLQILLIGISILMFAFADSEKTDEKVAKSIKNYYEEQMQLLSKQIVILKEREISNIPEENLKREFLKTRESFKQIEFLLVYNENKETQEFNGANIHVNDYTYVTPTDGKEPHGLQLMEDLIYNPAGESSRVTLRNEIKRFDDLLIKFYNRSKNQDIKDAKEFNKIIWDALRFEIYRIESLGITGFDVPDSENALPETKTALQSLKNVIQLFQPLFSKKNLKNELIKGRKILVESIIFIEKNNDFATFDRLTFIRNYLHPLSIWLTVNCDNLNLNFSANFSPINREAKHLFDETIFNSNYFASNSTPEKIELGKKLFNDPILSGNNERSCATCHNPEKGYADGLVKNTAIYSNELLLRNTPTLWNSVYQTKLFYDSRVKSLEKQSLAVIHNPLEMGGNLDSIILKVNQDQNYLVLFNGIYQKEATKNNLVDALSSFTQSIISFNSRFDKYIRNQSDNLTTEEKAGFNLFTGKAKCATCHFLPLFNGLVPPNYKETESEIIGAPISKINLKIIDKDKGKFMFTQLDLHEYAFKTSGIRNGNLTPPYMHNGVFSTLEEVVEFYNAGGGAGQGMNLENQTLPSDSLRLSKSEVKNIVKFIESLTDESQK